MIEQITDSWWKLTYDGVNRRFVFFGQTEIDVKCKFADWFIKMVHVL